MDKQLIIVSGCNAAGKSTFIRSRINQFEDFKIIMPDVYKSKTYEIFLQALSQGENIVLENILREKEVFQMIYKANEKNYKISLFQLFLKSPAKSQERVSFRALTEGSYNIDKEAVKINFDSNFKNLANSYYLFDEAYFIYTGIKNKNELILSFQKGKLVHYTKNDLTYIQVFADYIKSIGKDLEGFDYIKKNESYITLAFKRPDLLEIEDEGEAKNRLKP